MVMKGWWFVTPYYHSVHFCYLGYFVHVTGQPTPPTIMPAHSTYSVPSTTQPTPQLRLFRLLHQAHSIYFIPSVTQATLSTPSHRLLYIIHSGTQPTPPHRVLHPFHYSGYSIHSTTLHPLHLLHHPPHYSHSRYPVHSTTQGTQST